MNPDATTVKPERGKLLLVADDFSVRIALERALESEGYAVLSAMDLREALQGLARENRDLVVLDLDRSDGKGWPAFEGIHSAAPDVPVLLITARQDQYEGASSSSVSGILEKPLSLPGLIQQIDSALSVALSQRQSIVPKLMTEVHSAS